MQATLAHTVMSVERGAQQLYFVECATDILFTVRRIVP